MNDLIISEQYITNLIYTIRGKQVMLDSDIAKLYEVSTSRLNEQVKRNIKRFPEDFMFKLTETEWENLKSQNAISSWGGRRKLPNVFTEQGISSLSGVLHSDIAIMVNIAIMRAFVGMRNFLTTNANLFQRLDNIEYKQLETDNKVKKIINAIEKTGLPPNEGIFYNGQVFDAYVFVSDIIKTAKNSIVLIDNYIDETTLTILTKRNKNVKVTIYTSKITKQLKLDLEKYKEQYNEIKVKIFSKSHDRFLIIDKKTVYHIGASIKDLGKKWFAFSKININANELIKNIK